MYKYLLNEYNREVFVTDHLRMALHEMLSLINSRMKLFALSPTDVPTADIYVEEYIPCEGKLFKYVTNTITFDKYSPVLLMSLTPLDHTLLNDCCIGKLMCEIHKTIQTSLQQRQQPPLPPPAPAETTTATATATTTTAAASAAWPPPARFNSQIPPQQCVQIHPNELFSDDDDHDDIDDQIKQIEIQMKKLQNIKEQSKEQMDELRKMQDAATEELVDFSSDVNYIKKKRHMSMESEHERKTKFEADKRTYYMLKSDINAGKISMDTIINNPMFKDKYTVLEYLDTKGILNNEDDYYIYNQLFDKENSSQSESTYVPHNYNYLTDEEREKYVSTVEKYSDVVDEFMSKNSNNSTQNKSLNDILRELDAAEDGSTCHNTADAADAADTADTADTVDDDDHDADDVPEIQTSSNNYSNNNKAIVDKIRSLFQG